MLPGIITLNDKICDLEKEFGVTFTRNLGKEVIDGTISSIALLAYEWVVPNVSSNKRIVGCVGVHDSSTGQGAMFAVVLVNSGSAFTGFEIWDISSTVLQTSTTVFGSNPTNTGNTSALGVIDATYHDVTTTKLAGGFVRLEATLDVSFFWGLFDIDLMAIDITFHL